MAASIGDILRQPEYTGENRCEPCTALNLVIATLLGWLVSRRSKPMGILTVVVSTALVYLRGYLVPGTPTLTKRYLPPTVLRWFGKDPEPEVASGLGSKAPASGSDTAATPSDSRTEDDASVTSSTAGRGTGDSGSDRTDEFDLETHLLEYGVIVPCEDSEDLCLSDEFEAAWFDELEPLADGADAETEDIIEAFGFEDDTDELELVDYNDGVLLRSGTTHVGTWPSRTALLADIAASRIAGSWLSDWETYDVEERGQILNGLRMFLERCPGGGGVRMTEEAVESCCRPHTVFAVVCEETGERLFEHSFKGSTI